MHVVDSTPAMVGDSFLHGTSQSQAAPPDLGPGFPSVDAAPQSLAMKLHDWLATRMPTLFGLGANHVLKIVSDVTAHTGVNVEDLLHVERTMYRVMVPSRDGYVGGAPPIFQALANGQAAYVYLQGRDNDADHLTRLFTGLPQETLQKLGAGDDDLTPVRQSLLDRIQHGDFPAYVSVDGDLNHMSGTDSIATESLASIAQRENVMSRDFPDPTTYYRWLVTRVDSAFHRVDPWLYAVEPDLHAQIREIKTSLTPSWVSNAGDDPLGFIPTRQDTEHAYQTVMKILGEGRPPTYRTLTDFADTAVSLDRDLLFAVQTYWTKLLREIGPSQSESLLQPLARTWAALNVIPPDDPNFSLVSPDVAPYIELVEKKSGDMVKERYDRSVALWEVMNHTLDGLGIAERRQLLDIATAEVRTRADAIKAREGRLRTLLGSAYHGLDIDAILNDRVDASDPAVRTGLEELHDALGNTPVRPMTPLHAEILRHFTMMAWVAIRKACYAEPALALAQKLPLKTSEPLIVSEYAGPSDNNTPSSLPAGPSSAVVLGKPRPGHTPIKTSLVAQGGGARGFAYAECVNQTFDALASADGQVAVDEFIGTSAGAILAGLLAAGYTATEVGPVQQRLDFKRFYADYLWLAGSSDPQIRGIDRTGLFSTRQMYQTLCDLLAKKVHVQGRPVLFRDLGFKLKVVSTVINTDLPDDLKAQLGIGPDGQIVFSSDSTPNMDVAAAICASAAIPTFFEAPQLLVVRPEPDGSGGTRLAQYRLQLVDGGAVNNYAINQATDVDQKKSLLAAMPAYFEAPGSNPGDPPVSLSPLNFDRDLLDKIDAYNRKQYATFAPRLASFLQKAQDDGCERAVIGFNPAPMDQPDPIVQGRTRHETRHLRDLAEAVGFSTIDAKKGAKLLRNIYPKERNYAEQVLVDRLLDTEGTFKPSLCNGPSFTIGKHEANSVGDVAIAVTAANVTASSLLDTKLFEH